MAEVISLSDADVSRIMQSEPAYADFFDSLQDVKDAVAPRQELLNATRDLARTLKARSEELAAAERKSAELREELSRLNAAIAQMEGTSAAAAAPPPRDELRAMIASMVDEAETLSDDAVAAFRDEDCDSKEFFERYIPLRARYYELRMRSEALSGKK
jgi:septal ring factor EnvC (AmiA/AmiB activator)